jgi:hypothetical protein
MKMSLVLIVYLIGVLPNLASFFGVLGGVILLLILGTALYCTADMDSWASAEKITSHKALRKKALKFSWFPLLLILVANAIPSEKTMWYMIGAYGTQKLIDNPEAQALAADGVDVLKDLLAKAKKEINTPESKK